MAKINLFTHSQSAAQVIFQRCEQLAGISCMPKAVARYYLTPEHKTANTLVKTWMQAAGMHSWEDAAGNIWGRYKSAAQNAPTLILGSHLDTVANAGKYDGILGVLTAIAVVEQFNAQQLALPFHIDVVGFGDEEGVRFGTTLLGSCAVAGKWQQAWFELKDEQGITLQQALSDFGLGSKAYVVDNMASASRARHNILAYLELHIEQGPLLEHHNLPVGVVTSIAGAKRLRFKLEGQAGHAGTVPMALRQDPLCAAAQVISSIEAIAKAHQVVATVGSLNVLPGAVNVIPGACEFTLDIRSDNDAKRDAALQEIFTTLEEICTTRGIKQESQTLHSAAAVACSPALQAKMADTIRDFGFEALHLVSGAGHDAMVFSELTDIAMLFVRCAQGISHNPLESVTLQDVAVALEVYYSFVLSFANQEPSSAQHLDKALTD